MSDVRAAGTVTTTCYLSSFFHLLTSQLLPSPSLPFPSLLFLQA